MEGTRKHATSGSLDQEEEQCMSSVHLPSTTSLDMSAVTSETRKV